MHIGLKNTTAGFSAVSGLPNAASIFRGAAQQPADRTAGGVSKSPKTVAPTECQTCRNRRYKDQSNDPAVSFQSATVLSPALAGIAVRAHEQEHVRHEQLKAAEQDLRVVSQSVSIQYAICPECGRSYVAGGTTRTVTKSETPRAAADTSPAIGTLVDAKV